MSGASQVLSLRPSGPGELDVMLRRALAADPDGIELRFDDFAPSPAELTAIRGRCRSYLIGASRRPGRECALLQALQARFDAIDLDLESPLLAAAPGTLALCRRHGASLIASFHDDAAVPTDDELERLIDRLGRLGLAKIAVTPRAPEDVVRLAEAAARWRARGRRFILTAMGPLAAPARLLLPLVGSAITYLSLDQDSATAPGQLTLDRHRRILGDGAPLARRCRARNTPGAEAAFA